MSAPVRMAILLSALALLVIVKSQQPGSLLALGGEDPADFPGDVVARATQPPNIYADKPKVRVLQLIDSMNAMWGRALADAGDAYAVPRIETRADERGEGCGGDVGGWAGIYCRATKSIVIDLGDHLVGRAAVGDDGADLVLGYVLAHEVGHHVQALRGFAGLRSDVLRAELHAQCLAGVWGRAAGRPVPPEWSYGVDADHGTLAQQVEWLSRGYARARPADCDAVWDAPGLSPHR